jgi:hypothetical protein
MAFIHVPLQLERLSSSAMERPMTARDAPAYRIPDSTPEEQQAAVRQLKQCLDRLAPNPKISS